MKDVTKTKEFKLLCIFIGLGIIMIIAGMTGLAHLAEKKIAYLLKHKVAPKLGTGRKLKYEEINVNPFTQSVTIPQFTIYNKILKKNELVLSKLVLKNIKIKDNFPLAMKIYIKGISTEREELKYLIKIRFYVLKGTIAGSPFCGLRGVYRENIEKYVLKIVDATRNPDQYSLPELKPFIGHGASPRASIYLIKAARAHALVEGRDYVLPDDVKGLVGPVLCHRLILEPDLWMKRRAAENILEEILRSVRVPVIEEIQR